jgi:shikimate kinase
LASHNQQRSIALVGFMAAGKSKIGRLLARRLELPFVDTDKLIEDSLGLSVAEIFRERGEAAFREAERDTIGSLLKGDAHVIATGGGAFVDEQTRDALNRNSQTVWLDAPFELVVRRLARSSRRPLATGKPVSELRDLWNERRKSYAQAHFHIRVTGGDPERLVARILKALKETG